MKPRASFNTLPPRAEYLSAVRKVLALNKEMTLSTIVQAAKLTRTQTLCALEELVRTGIVVYDLKTRSYSQNPLGDAQ
jgi:hypothetical protein